MSRAFATTEYVDVEQRTDPTFSVGDAALSEYLGLSGSTIAGVSVNQTSALGLSAVYRSVALISGTVAGLPLKTYRRTDTTKTRVPSFLDDPGGATGLTSFEWTELVLAHLLLSGNAYLLHVYGGAGQIVDLQPIVPSAVAVEPHDEFGKVFKITDRHGKVRELTPLDVSQIMGPTLDGLRGLSVISVARQSLGTAIAGDMAAARMYSNGLMLGGILTAADTVTPEQADAIKAGFKARAQGVRNSGDVAFVPADVKFSPWTMSAEDAQFLELRKHSVDEISRLFGVPREMLSEAGASSWGSGIQELVRAFQKFCLAGWAARIEQRLTRLLPKNSFAEFDFSGLLQPSPEVEITLLLQQVAAGLITVDEARAIRNMGPLPTAVPEAVQETEVAA